MEIFKKFWNKINTAEYNKYLKSYYAQKADGIVIVPHSMGYAPCSGSKEEKKAEKFYKLARGIAMDCENTFEMGQAMDYYGKAAKMGHIPAIYECAQLILIMAENSLLDGEPTIWPTIIEVSIAYLEDAAMAGIEDARRELETLYFKKPGYF